MAPLWLYSYSGRQRKMFVYKIQAVIDRGEDLYAKYKRPRAVGGGYVNAYALLPRNEYEIRSAGDTLYIWTEQREDDRVRLLVNHHRVHTLGERIALYERRLANLREEMAGFESGAPFAFEERILE